MSMETMFSALESSRLRSAVCKARDRPDSLAPAGEGKMLAFFWSAVLRVSFLSDKNNRVSLLCQETITKIGRVPCQFQDKSCFALQAGTYRRAASRSAVEESDERGPWMNVQAGGET